MAMLELTFEAFY